VNEAAGGKRSGLPATTAKTLLASIDREKFTAKGFEELSERVDLFIKDVADESARIARRYRTDLISAFHVEKAAEHIASGSALKIYRHAGTIGGILLGGGLSEVLSMLSTDTATIIGLITSSICFVVGAVLITLYVVKD